MEFTVEYPLERHGYFKAAWPGETVALEVRRFRALGQAPRPAPARPMPPLRIGGNSVRARRRAAAHGLGWTPMLAAGRRRGRQGGPA